MRHNRRNHLFSDGDLSATLDAQLRSVKSKVEGIPREQFLASSIDTLVEHIEGQLCVEPLVLHEDRMTMTHAETKIDVTGRFDYGAFGNETVQTDGHQLQFVIPYSGDPVLWKLRPNMWSSVMPQGDVEASRSELVITLQNTSNTAPEWYQKELKDNLARIKQSMAAQHTMLSQYNTSVAAAVREAAMHRRQQVEKLHGLLASFDIPMTKKPGMPEYKPVEVRKKVVRPLPRVSATGYKPEPAINDERYEEILANIRHMGATFEGTPQTYESFGEEGLRDVLLASLNGTYEGAATGEAFRKYGKTDIRIEEESRSAFVGECKLWKGEQVMLEALVQLLGYLTWRDCKAALILFNKGVAGFSSVQQKIAEVLPQHPLFLRAKNAGQEGEWRFVFRSPEDDGREVIVHVFCFNLFVAPERSGKKR